MISDYGQLMWVLWPKLDTEAFIPNLTSDFTTGRLVWFLIYHYINSDYGQLMWVVWVSFGAEIGYLGFHSEPIRRFQFR
jgi:hypothetical protein